METLVAHKNDKFLYSELDWLVNYKPPPPKDSIPNWKNCKLLGSILDTENDIKRRKILTIDAMKKLNNVFNSARINIQTKMRCFKAYINSVFLYNSELWCMNKTLEESIDAFQRRQLRYSLGIKYPKLISSDTLYMMTKAEKWSKTIKRRRLNWLGHVMRLPANTPARMALNEHLRHNKGKKGRPKSTWMRTIKKDLEVADIFIDINDKSQTINTLEEITKDRRKWSECIKVLMQ